MGTYNNNNNNNCCWQLYQKSHILFNANENENLFKYPTKLRYKNENLVVISNKINIKFESIRIT